MFIDTGSYVGSIHTTRDTNPSFFYNKVGSRKFQSSNHATKNGDLINPLSWFFN